MNTQDSFKALPMAKFDSMSRPRPSYNNIPYVSLESLQDRVQPRQVGTGNNRGEMTIKGLIRVVDRNQVVRLILGYKVGEF